MKVGSLVQKIPNTIPLTEEDKMIMALALSFGYQKAVDMEIYTVRGIVESGEGIYLEEIMNPIIPAEYFESGFAHELYFLSRLFQEVQPPMEVDISEVQFYPTPKKDSILVN